uniref:Tumor necrosis factor receptor superfamily, member 1a n=1 Tax=Nothobranchius furzeri TaxID=105023 RepID=A0A8C6KG37_NOTFU
MLVGNPAFIFLLIVYRYFQFTFIFAATLNLVTPKCPVGDYENKDGICCNKCPAGFKLVAECHSEGHRSNCTPCPARHCKSFNFVNFSAAARNEVEVSPCRAAQNTICGCKVGYYKNHIDSETVECLKCSRCKPDETEEHACTRERDTVCGCKENFYRVRNKCPEPKNHLLINLVAGSVVVVLVLLALVVLVTFLATKRFTKKKMPTLSSQTSEVSHLLIYAEGPPQSICLKAAAQNPVGELELSKLPDCVPLEIKIPELIYAVLDLVPVLQVKQLVRCLGVKDTEIERAEMDHRSCREAHYQMLRVWAQKGSQELGGGRGEMLHRPLLEELLDKLRQMHLGRAAEELETKYSIQ